MGEVAADGLLVRCRVSIFANGGMLAPNRNGDEILSQQSASFHGD
jgi:hypothetical protein